MALRDDADLGLTDALAQLSFLVYGLLADQAATHELSMIQTRMLGILRDREPTMQELAALLGLDKSSVTGLIDRAERRGYVRRTRSNEDRRAFRVRLTAAGRRSVNRAAAGFQAQIREATACLSPMEAARLSRLATRVVIADAESHGIVR